MTKAAEELRGGIRESTDLDSFDRMMKEFGELQLQQSRENRQLLTEVVEKLTADNQQVVERLFERLSEKDGEFAQMHIHMTKEIGQQIDCQMRQLAQHLVKPQAQTGFDRLIDVAVEIGSAIASSMTAKPEEVEE